MPWDENTVFDDATFILPRRLVGEYEFYLDGISRRIQVRIYKELKANVPSDPFLFSTSHFIHTPDQAGPYTPSAPWCGDELSALRRAVESIASYYRESVSKGRNPSDDWLVANEHF